VFNGLMSILSGVDGVERSSRHASGPHDSSNELKSSYHDKPAYTPRPSLDYAI
jgi:hypothetical protein